MNLQMNFSLFIKIIYEENEITTILFKRAKFNFVFFILSISMYKHKRACI